MAVEEATQSDLIPTMNVSLRLLRVFLAVGREGNLGRTAAMLEVSEPSVSQDIRRLEQKLGAQVFKRGPRGVELTSAGVAFHRDIEDALALIDVAVKRAQHSGREKRQTIVLGFSPSIGQQLLPAILPVLEQRLRSIAVDEREVDTGEVTRGVRSGAFDLGLAHCQGAEVGLRAVTLRQERLCVALVAGHPLSDRDGPVHLRELGELSLMVWPREVAPEYYDALAAICRRAGLSPAIVSGPRRSMIRSYALSDGDIFCLLPLSNARLHVPGVCFIPVADDGATVALNLLCRERENRPTVAAVWDLLVEQVPQLLDS
jgi:DNA-binding transcriptional LysR family regulator